MGQNGSGTDGGIVLPTGLATGVGSLPHFDPGEAVDFVLRHTPRFPSAPSLPARSRKERMIAQATLGVRGIEVGEDGSLAIDTGSLDTEDPLEGDPFPTEGYTGLRAFLTAVSERDDPIKVQLTGPATVGVALHAAGLPADLAFDVAVSVVRARAAALLQLLDERVPQCTRAVFLDEPVLVGALEPEFPIAPDRAMDLVSSCLAVLERGAISGLHCCGSADWKLVLATGAQIVSLPADANVESAVGAFAAHLERGGWLAWGAVPTHEPVGDSVDRLWRRLSAVWCRLVEDGCDPVRLRTQAVITPECGLGLHGVPQAEQVMEFTTELAERLHDQAVGVRLSVGA